MAMTQTVESGAAVRERARALAQTIEQSEAFRAYKVAEAALDADAALGSTLAALQARDQELGQSQAWGGADPTEVRAVQQEWQDLATNPILVAHAAARENLIALFGEVAVGITEGTGIDFGSACAPAGGCCG
ncbi:MAG: YlbF family regulator [Trueperaceae bacterium]|nr:YlbF family regulator [Trueperaceae bacterium]